jgi:DNA invertase Pin-like site-specific DNA recombinase
LGEEAVRRMIEARLTGMRVKEVAREYGVSESSVKRIFASHEYAPTS